MITAQEYIETNIWYIENDMWEQFFDQCPPIILNTVIELIEQSGIKVPDFENQVIYFWYRPNGNNCALVAPALDPKSLDVIIGVDDLLRASDKERIAHRNIFEAKKFCDKFSREMLGNIELHMTLMNANPYLWIPIESKCGVVYITSEQYLFIKASHYNHY